MSILSSCSRCLCSSLPELLEKKTREDSDLEVLSKRVASLQQVIDGHAEREEQSQRKTRKTRESEERREQRREEGDQERALTPSPPLGLRNQRGQNH